MKGYEEKISKGFNGFGLGEWADVEYINKALDPSWTYNVLQGTAGDALRVQSLEYTLKIVTYQTKHFAFWKEIPKLPAYSTIEEYTRLDNVARSAPGAAFFTGGAEAPPAEDSNYSRQYAVVKYLGTTRAITLAMAKTRTILGDLAGLIAQENLNATNWILRNVEWGLFNGYSKGRNGAEFIHWDGLPYLIDSSNVIDALDYNANGYIEEKMIQDAAQLVLNNYGVPTHIILPTSVMGDLMKLFADRQRVFLPTGSGYQAGVLISQYMVQSGPVDLIPDIFLEKTPSPVATTTGNLTSYATLTSITGNLPNGDYKVGIEFIDVNGNVVNNTIYVATVSGTTGIRLSITGEPDASNHPAHQLWIYLSEKNSNELYLVKKTYRDTAGTQTITLDGKPSNHIMPNTYQVFIGELNANVFAFKQLAPLVKMDLAVIGPAYRWMVLLYGTPIMYAPRKWARIVNLKNIR